MTPAVDDTEALLKAKVAVAKARIATAATKYKAKCALLLRISPRPHDLEKAP